MPALGHGRREEKREALNRHAWIRAALVLALSFAWANVAESTCPQPPQPEPHFECYSVDKHTPRQDYTPVLLKDQFDSVEARLGDIVRICTPVSKNGERIPDPDLHLVCYEIEEGHDVSQAVLATNQFGKIKMKVRQAKELCVPSKKRFP